MSSLPGTTHQAAISCSASGDNTLIAAPGAGKYIAVDFIAIVPNSAVTVAFKNGSTLTTGVMSLTANQGFVLDNAVHELNGILKCTNNNALVITLGGAVQVSGTVLYRIVGY